MKKEWRGYNLLDLFLISMGFIAVIISSIIFKAKLLILFNTLLALLCVFTQAKGKIATQFIGIIYFCIYIYVINKNITEKHCYI